MKRTIIATFEENEVKYARVKDSYWYMTEYYTTCKHSPSMQWTRMDTGETVQGLRFRIEAYEITKQLGDKFESKTVRKILR